MCLTNLIFFVLEDLRALKAKPYSTVLLHIQPLSHLFKLPYDMV